MSGIPREGALSPAGDGRSAGEAGWGALYLAIGQSYADEAVRSVESLRARMPGLPTVIFCDDAAAVPDGLFDRRLPLVAGLPWGRQKVHTLLRSPFERSVFLDTDTFVADAFWELFDLLDRFELAMALSPWWMVSLGQGRGETFDRGVPVCFPKPNSGVIAFRSSPAVQALLGAWDRTHAELGLVGQDQDSLRMVLYEGELRWATLPPAYNYRLPYPGGIRGGIKILHGRHPDLAGVCRSLNRTDRFRAILPPARAEAIRFGAQTAAAPGLGERLGRVRAPALLRRGVRKLRKRFRMA